MFKMGEKVYHKNLKKIGIFDGYDDLDKSTCHVLFEYEPGVYEDYRRVSINQLVVQNDEP